MNQRVIYPTSEGGVAILIPITDCGLTIEEIALKDVPAGTPYQIIDVSDVPSDRTFRDAWEYDFSQPDGYGIGADAWFELKRQQSEVVNDQG